MSKLTPAQRDFAFKILLARKEPEAQRALFVDLVKAVDIAANSFLDSLLTDEQLQTRCQAVVNEAVLNWWSTRIPRSPKDLTDYKVDVEIKTSKEGRYCALTYSAELQLMFSGASVVRYLVLPPGQELEDMIEAEYNSL